jgi:serine/threonine protein kinase
LDPQQGARNSFDVSDDVESLAREICSERKLTFEKQAGNGAFKRSFLVHGDDGPRALKIVVGPIDAERVAREIAALRACEHPAICRLYDVGTHLSKSAPVAYLIEEFVPGGTLSEKMALEPLSRAEGIEYGLLLSEAIAHLADRRLVHRDIKPDNILLREDGRPVLIDLGVARDLADTSLTHTWLVQGPGTPAFAPPEQLRNEKSMIDWRADQFSLGITLSLAILGMHPYTGSNTLDGVVERVANRSNVSASFVEAAQENNLSLLRKMVTPWPIHRFTRPAQLVDAWLALRGQA